MTSLDLPKTHRALVLSEIGKDPVVQEVPFPKCTPGSAVLRISVAGVLDYSRAIYDGRRQYPMPTPLTIGTSAIGRVVQVAEDATSLAVGQLVFVDCYIRGRDDKRISFLSGIHEGTCVFRLEVISCLKTSRRVLRWVQKAHAWRMEKLYVSAIRSNIVPRAAVELMTC